METCPMTQLGRVRTRLYAEWHENIDMGGRLELIFLSVYLKIVVSTVRLVVKCSINIIRKTTEG